jgi:hypothetical protein
MVAPMLEGALVFLALLAQSAASSGASNFTLVNGTSSGLANLSIRRAGSQDWKPLGAAPAAGARAPISFKDQDCAFDIRAQVDGKDTVTWAGVNLCEVKSVKLNHDPSAGAWVDYDQ